MPGLRATKIFYALCFDKKKKTIDDLFLKNDDKFSFVSLTKSVKTLNGRISGVVPTYNR